MLLRRIRLGVKGTVGYLYKWAVDFHLLSIPSLEDRNGDEEFIVSLTSYGRRVKTNVVYYTLVSLLRQTVRPSKIVLCLDKTKWSENNLPSKLLSLKSKGIEFLFCDDVRSYTKLVSALIKYRDCPIITVDDDIWYDKHTIEQLIEAHNQNPNDICCIQALKVESKNGILSKYVEWEDLKGCYDGRGRFFPEGFGGVLYPKKSLHPDVVDSNLFLELCPMADDIWFWFCGLRNNTEITVIKKKGADYSFDALYQFFHKGSALTHSNRFENQNDIQIQSILSYYGLRVNNGRLESIDKNTPPRPSENPHFSNGSV